MFKRGGKHELDKIQDKLRTDEEVLHVITQKHFMKPSTYFITNQRMIIRDPSFFGDDVQSLMWNEVGDIEISKGPLRATISFHRGHGGLDQSTASSGFWSIMGRRGDANVFTLTDIGKSEAEDVYNLLDDLIRRVRESEIRAQMLQQQPQLQPSQQQSQQSPLDILKTKFVNGEITAEEYETKKKILES